jgi:hypothetical protein
VLVLVAYLGLAFLLYGPALDGDFISDDRHYVEQNVYVHEPTGGNLVAILNPTSVVSVLVENYAPVHLLAHSLEWQFFGSDVRGYHVVNVILHATVAWLLVLLFQRSPISAPAAIFAGFLFLAHPANVEAVAWISQLKTSLAMLLMILALFAHPRWPLLGVIAFGLALLAKPTAAVALPVLIVWGWVRTRPENAAGTSWRWGWVGVWGLVFAAFAVAELAAFSKTAGQAPALYPDLEVRFRTTFAIAMRYIARAVTGQGVSVFQEPPPADSWWDPWWIASVFLLSLLAWRTWVTLKTRNDEAIWWTWAAVSFAPVSGLIPLPYPMADRYLYFMLPGLMGGALLAGPALGRWLNRQSGGMFGTSGEVWRMAAMAIALGVGIFFSVQTWERAHVWQKLEFFMAEAARNYPDGVVARTRQASRAARGGNTSEAIASLRAARARGYNRIDNIFRDPAYQVIGQDPAFTAFMDAWANEEILRLQANSAPSQIELRVIAQIYIVLDDLPRAEETVLQAIEIEGPIGEDLQTDLEQIRRHRRIQERALAR